MVKGNTTGGKNFKKFKSGGEGFRAKAAREAADEILEILQAIDKRGKEKLSADETEVMRYMFAGRVMRRFGHGRMEVLCSDGVTRQCRIRGLLRKRGQVNIDIDSLVVISTREAVDDESDDETGVKVSHASGGATSDIVGLFNEKQAAQLRKTTVNRCIFASARGEGNDNGGLDYDIFDRDHLLEEDKEDEDGTAVGAGKAKKAGRAQSGLDKKLAAADINEKDDMPLDIDNI
jgi:translation initiation factor IF-1